MSLTRRFIVTLFAATILPLSSSYFAFDVAIPPPSKSSIGLGNVDNTSDLNKPVSTAQATAISARLSATSNLADLTSAPSARTNLGLGNLDNTSDLNKPVSTAQATAISARLVASSNLADLTSVATARTNLSVDSSIGVRIRRAAEQARGATSWSKPYMRAVKGWQPSTAYLGGNVVAHGGNLYVCIVGGTSATSGGPTSTGATSTTDGTVGWMFYGINQVTVDPSQTITTWPTSSAVSLGQLLQAGSKLYTVTAAGSTGSSAPTSTSNVVTDGSATLSYFGQYQANPYSLTIPVASYSTSAPSLTNVFNAQKAANAGVIRAQVVAGGSGYVVGDTITVAGGTASTAAVLRVAGVSSGAVTSLTVASPGSYTVIAPGGPATQGATSGAGSGATFALQWPDPPFCRLRGCYLGGAISSTSTTGVRLMTFQPTANVLPKGAHFAVEFYSDSPIITLQNNQNLSSFGLVIDGIRHRLDGSDSPTGTSNFYTYDFTNAGGRKVRHFRIECQTTFNLLNIYTDNSSQIWPPGDVDSVTAAYISDSIWAGSGYGPFVVGNCVSMGVSGELGWRNWWDLTIGGTGYLNRGTAPGVSTDSFGTRIAEAAARNPDIWLLMGSTNDLGYSTASITAAVLSTLQSIRSQSSSPIVIFDLWSLNNTSSLPAADAAIAAAVTSFNDPKCFYISILNDPYFPWLSGSWNNAPATSGYSQSTSTNNNAYLAQDGTHPPDPGTQYLISRIVKAIRERVLPYL